MVTNSIICPKCKHQNRVGMLLCEQCGTSLIGIVSTTTRSLTSEETVESTGSTPPTRMGSSAFEPQMTLVIQIVGASAPLRLRPLDLREILFGRLDATAGIHPQVDLTPYAAFQMGISRRHATILYRDNQLLLQDLRSANGTFLNGVRLVPNDPQLLRNGDEIRMGQMNLNIRYE